MLYRGNVTLIIPSDFSSSEQRLRIWKFLESMWRNKYPDWEIILGTCEGTWRKGVAISNAVEKARNGVVIIADADVWLENVEETFSELIKHPVVKPFGKVARINKDITELILSGKVNMRSLNTNAKGACVREVYESKVLGGMVVSLKEFVLRVPVDPRFYNWGWEDEAWFSAVRCLEGDISLDYSDKVLSHLWHPIAVPNERLNKNNIALANSYRNAPESKVTKLIEEGKRWRTLNYSGEIDSTIPKIIHQIWLGDESKKPTELMETWKIPGWEYKLWTEKEIEEFGLKNKKVYDFYYNEGIYFGCSDVARIEILERFGGVYIDADVVKLEDISDLLGCHLFAVKENIPERPSLRHIVNTIIGSPRNHQILVNYIARVGKLSKFTPVWSTVGGTLFTEVIDDYIVETGGRDVLILKPHTFFPLKKDGTPEEIDGKVYAKHLWGSTSVSTYSYEKVNDLVSEGYLSLGGTTPTTERSIKFIVTKGTGVATPRMEEGIKRGMYDNFPILPVPGSLNLKLKNRKDMGEVSEIVKSLTPIVENKISLDDGWLWETGNTNYLVTLYGLVCGLRVFDGHFELISEVHLRDTFGLSYGDEIEIVLPDNPHLNGEKKETHTIKNNTPSKKTWAQRKREKRRINNAIQVSDKKRSS